MLLVCRVTISTSLLGRMQQVHFQAQIITFRALLFTWRKEA